ncbi:MAG: hypothetical protein AB7G12_02850 [Thermoanaerobaculia bacterium]
MDAPFVPRPFPHPPRIPLPAWIFLLSALTLAPAAPAIAEEAPPDLRLVDRIVAVVDDDPVLESEIERALGLGLVRREEGETEPAVRRRALDQIISQRLRQHELDRFGFDEAPLSEIERDYAEIHARFASEAEFQAELSRLGLDEDKLRQLVAHQIAVLTYVEERLGPRVFISVDDIRAYYDETLVPELRRLGEAPPPVEEVREQIRAVLREQRLNEEVARWTEELRRRADVEDFLDDGDRALPPLLPPA